MSIQYKVVRKKNVQTMGKMNMDKKTKNPLGMYTKNIGIQIHKNK